MSFLLHYQFTAKALVQPVRLKETVSPNSVVSIVSLKGLSSTLGIVFFKGESGYLGNCRMPTHRPWEREKARPEKEGKRPKRDKKGGKILPGPTLFSHSLCVLTTGLMVASGLGWRPKEVRMCVFLCVCVSVVVDVLYCVLHQTAETSLYLSHIDAEQNFGDSSSFTFMLSISIRLINMLSTNTERPQAAEAFMASHAANSITVKSIYAYTDFIDAIHVQNVTIHLQFEKKLQWLLVA